MLNTLSAAIAAGVIADGWWTGCNEQLLAPNPALHQAIGLLRQHGYLAGIGRQHRLAVERSIRGDRIAWLDHDTCGVLGDWHRCVSQLGQTLRQELFLPISETEMMVSRYARGAGYARHVDQHAGVGARLLSVIYYLNPDWHSADGGCLQIWDQQGRHELAPIAGRLVVKPFSHILIHDQFFACTCNHLLVNRKATGYQDASSVQSD